MRTGELISNVMMSSGQSLHIPIILSMTISKAHLQLRSRTSSVQESHRCGLTVLWGREIQPEDDGAPSVCLSRAEGPAAPLTRRSFGGVPPACLRLSAPRSSPPEAPLLSPGFSVSAAGGWGEFFSSGHNHIWTRAFPGSEAGRWRPRAAAELV